MRHGLLLLVSLFLMLPTASLADDDHITLKKSFWGGWQFSTDGTRYQPVGMSATDVAPFVESCPVALQGLESYRKRKTAAAVTGMAGVIVVGLALASTSFDFDLFDTSRRGPGPPVYLVGAGLVITSTVIEISATRALRNAVGAFNDGNCNDVHSDVAGGFDGGRVALSFRF